MANEEIREENIRRAIEVGINALITDGIKGIQKEKISKEMGVTVRSLTRYFHTKENFIITIVKQMYQRDYDLAKSYLDEHHMEDKTGIEQLSIFFDSVQKVYAQQEKRILRMVEAQLFLKNSNDSEMIKTKLGQTFNMYEKIIERCILNGQQDGSIKTITVEPEIAANTITAATWGMLHQCAFMSTMGLKTNEETKSMLRDYFIHILDELAA